MALLDNVDLRLVVGSLIIAYAAYAIVLPRITHPLRSYPGPESASILMGNLREIFDSGPGEAHLKWVRKYGTPTVVYNGFLGDKRIVTCDPAALNHILLSRPYDYPKPAQVRGQLAQILGRGVLFAEGDAHKRQRRILQPAFAKTHIDALVPMFFEQAAKLRDIWMRDMENEQIIDVTRGLSRLTLDIIGSGGFGADFDTLNNKENKLAAAFASMFGASQPSMTFLRVLLFFLMRYMPFLVKLPTKRLKAIQASFAAMEVEGNKLFEDRKRAVSEGDQDTKDLLSLLVKSNGAENAKGRLSDSEISGQISTILLAGHALTWILHLLSSRPKMQARLREEIREAFAASKARNEEFLSPDALQALPYLDAVCREALRFHPPVSSTLRTPAQDDILPLSEPITLKNGKTVNTIPVRKGSTIFMSVVALNFSKELYGEDADEFNPDRWLHGVKAMEQIKGFVAYSPLLTFLGGPRGCIGYRFSIAELKAILSIIIVDLAFEPRDDRIEFEAHSQIVTRPYIKGELEKGSTMPLRVSKAL